MCELELDPKLDQYLTQELGPACRKRFEDPEVLALFQDRLGRGASFEDAVLGTAHQLSAEDPLVADEFLGHFLGVMMRLGHFAMNPGLRRFLDTGDLVGSVMGGLWRDMLAVEYRTRKEFLAYLGQRMKWKATDHVRALHAGRRREDLRREMTTPKGDPLDLPGNRPLDGPSTQVALREERELLALALLKLPPRDRDILQRHLRGESHMEIATALGIQVTAARKAYQRALERARSLMPSGH